MSEAAAERNVLRQGDLIVVSHWRDFDFPNDEVRLGKFAEFRDGYFYIQGSKRGYKYCRRVQTKLAAALGP